MDAQDTLRSVAINPTVHRAACQDGLYRALNVGRVIGFLGSGVSVACGRPTWNELVASADETIKALSFEFESAPRYSGAIDNELVEMKRTLDRFRSMKNRDGEGQKLFLEVIDRFSCELDRAARRRVP